MMSSSAEILAFWFTELKPEQWWRVDPHLDQEITHRFSALHARAAYGELDDWRIQPLGRLAEIIILDQFSRHIYRGQPQSFVCDGMALVLAQEAIRLNIHRNFAANYNSFLYLPFMHSESQVMQVRSIELYSAPGLEFNLDFAYQHKRIIDRFGRYPHRNEILHRQSTPEEEAFLQQPGSSF